MSGIRFTTVHRLAVLAAVGALLAGGCSSGSSGSSGSTGARPSSSPSTGPSEESSAAPSGLASSPSTPPPVSGTVTLALDWTPNTNHTGFYVAQQSGWYAQQAIKLTFIPYASANPETLVGSGQADCGISTEEGATFAIAAGEKEQSVMAILQHSASEIAVLASSPITRPRDMDGKVYAGFGSPQEGPLLTAVIKADGGKGKFTTVTLDTAAYEALYAGKADMAITFSAWEAIEAKERGIALRTFAFPDYGLPDEYAVVLVCNNAWLAANPGVARQFLGATVRGFQLASTDPTTAAQLLIAANPGVFDANPQLPVDSADYLAAQKLYLDPSGAVGPETLATWDAYSGWLYDQGVLAGPDGKPLTTRPDFSSYFTNQYLP
jgi:ABC-type nitrate/sulfonate/bicarbonate transport system substrate-binding protein